MFCALHRQNAKNRRGEISPLFQIGSRHRKNPPRFLSFGRFPSIDVCVRDTPTSDPIIPTRAQTLSCNNLDYFFPSIAGLAQPHCRYGLIAQPTTAHSSGPKPTPGADTSSRNPFADDLNDFVSDRFVFHPPTPVALRRADVGHRIKLDKFIAGRLRIEVDSPKMFPL